MRLEDMLKDISGITNQVVKTNCFEGQNTLLDSILLLQTKMNEVIQAINDGIIKGDKGDTPNVQVGNTETLEPNSNASVTQTGDMLNPIFNFGIPKGEKGDKGDTGKASESIQDDVVSLDTCYSSEKTVSLFNDLKNIQGVKYGNDVGYQVCKGTHNGVVKDLKLYGKSLVSRFSKKHTETNISILYSGILSSTGFKVEIGKTYTILGTVKSPTKNMCDIYYQESNINIATFKGIPLVFNATKNETLRFVSLETGLYVLDDIMILEGVHSQNPPNYFEGIASVGNGNEIEVLSVNGMGNLFDIDSVLKSKNFDNINGDDNTKLNGVTFDLIPNNVYKITNKYDLISGTGKFLIQVFYTNGSYDYVEPNTTLITNNPNKIAKSIRLTYSTLSKIKNVNVIVNTQNGNIDKYIADKKTILFKDTDNTWKPLINLRGIDENNCDIVDSVNGKYIKKYINYKFTGNETIDYVTDYGDVSRFSISNIPVYSKLNAKILCDKFNVVTIGTPNVEGINSHATIKNYVSIQIKTNKLETKDREGFKKWLIANPTEITIELETPLEYEINPLYPDSYEGDTMVLFNTGVIPCKNEFYIDSNLGSLQLETNERLSRIENTIYQSNIALLRGDFRTLAQMYYPEDFIKEEELTNE